MKKKKGTKKPREEIGGDFSLSCIWDFTEKNTHMKVPFFFLFYVMPPLYFGYLDLHDKV